jgi:hypothetical protein
MLARRAIDSGRCVSAAGCLMLALGGHGAPVLAQRSLPQPFDSAARFSGRVVRSTDGSPITGVDVWITAVDRHVLTDSTGAFRFAGLAQGLQLVQLRHVGYEARRDTVTLFLDREITRVYTLDATAASLDTVHTIAGQQKYFSPLLRGFEARRLSGQGGRFVSDSEFRRNETSSLPNLLSSRMPGMMVRRGILLSSRRACRGPQLSSKGACQSQPNCYVSIYLDGAMLYSARMADAGAPPPDLSKTVPITTLAGAEFYAGGVLPPAGMHSDDEGCGTLWLWTRER